MKIEFITRDEYIKRTKYWVYTWFEYCPACNSTVVVERQRILESDRPRPKEWNDRNEVEERYNYCLG